MATKYLLISLPEKFESKFKNMLKNLNALNGESGIVIVEGEYGEKPEYVAIHKEKK